MFLAASGFLIGGLALSLVTSTWPLFLGSRLLQAVGTGIFIPLMMSTVLAVAPKQKMGTYLSIGSCMITFGPALAPVVSGIMVTTFGWRSVFVPPALLTAVLAVAGSAQAGGAAANVAQADGFAAAVAVACVIAAIGTVLAFAYALKRRRLARNAQEGQTSVAVAEAAPAVVVDTVPAMAAGRD